MNKIQVKINGEWREARGDEYIVDLLTVEDIRLINETKELKVANCCKILVDIDGDGKIVKIYTKGESEENPATCGVCGGKGETQHPRQEGWLESTMD